MSRNKAMAPFRNLNFPKKKKTRKKILEINSPGKVKLSAALRFALTANERKKMKMTRQTIENDKLGIRREMFINYN